MKTIIGGKGGEKFNYNHFLKMARIGMKITIRNKEYEFIDELKWYNPEFHGNYEPGLVLRRLGNNYRGPVMAAYTYSDLEKMVEKGIKITYEPL